jgi:glycerol 2-dehydrogenase (NADP+)
MCVIYRLQRDHDLETVFVDLLHWPAPMTNEWKADKSLNWLDTWREIENVYRKHPEKVKAIGMHLRLGSKCLARLKWLRVDRCLQRLGGLPRGLAQAPQRNSSCREPGRTSSVCPILQKYIHLASSCLLARVSSCLEEDVLAACEKAGIVVTAYSPLGSDQSPLLKNDVVLRLAEKYNITPANVLISFQVNTPNVTGEECRQISACSVR